MNKKIEDYLHLYLGCEMNYATHHEPQNEKYILSVDNLKEAIEFGDIPLLRPLSSMTEEEYAQVGMIAFDKSGIKNIQSAAMLGEGIVKYGIRTDSINTNFEVTRYLLSKYFDLFGLIESGLAIDKTKQHE